MVPEVVLGHKRTLSRGQRNCGMLVALLRTGPVASVFRVGSTVAMACLICFFLQARQPARLFECGLRCRVDVIVDFHVRC